MVSKKVRTVFLCRECGASAAKWLGKCPSCGSWSSLVEQTAVVAGASRTRGGAVKSSSVLSEVQADVVAPLASGINELDRVLGGGVFEGAVILVGGEPGIGKSTLLLQALSSISQQGIKSLYVSGEESASQIAQRADRLNNVDCSDVLLLSTLRLEDALSEIETHNPRVIVVDSVQTLQTDAADSAPGTVTQLREVTARLVDVAKQKGVAVFLVGHVTKEGQIAGPKLLEHLVDTVLSFETDSTNTLRILRATKNRFGSTEETAVFEMSSEGLIEVVDPSGLYLRQRGEDRVGSVVVPTLAGSRSVLLEVQALVASAAYGTARRVVSGIDSNRLAILLAVLDRRCGIHVLDQDVFVSVAGGVRLHETASDVAVALAVVSSLRDRATSANLAALGEVGLSGEIRSVPRLAQRVSECSRHGFEAVLVPECSIKDVRRANPGVRVEGVRSLGEALEYAFS